MGPSGVASSRTTSRRDPASELRLLLAAPPALTLAVAESVTCGRVQAAIGAVPGASEFFLGGVTAYSVEQKVRHLGVSRAVLDTGNPVTAEVAAEMAMGVCRLFGSNLGLSTTGYAEANPDAGYAVPGAFWAIARGREGEDVRVIRHGFFQGHGLDRVAMQTAVADEVLGALVEYVRLFRAAEKQTRFA